MPCVLPSAANMFKWQDNTKPVLVLNVNLPSFLPSFYYFLFATLLGSIPSRLPSSMEILHQSHTFPIRDRRADSLGDFKYIPDEIICTILDCLTPLDLARLACVSRFFLWLSVLFFSNSYILN